MFDSGKVMQRMLQVLSGNPSNDATCAGCRCIEFMLSTKIDKQGKRRSSLRPEDVHDVLVPLFLGKEDAAKDAAAKALRKVRDLTSDQRPKPATQASDPSQQLTCYHQPSS